MKANKAFGDCEGPFGFPMRSEEAKEVEQVLAGLSKEVKELGYKRVFKAPDKIELLEGERADVSLVTTDAVDRDREVVSPKGLNWKQFLKNPVVTFAHDYRAMPVGRSLWVKRSKDPDGWLAKTRYTPRPDNWQGEWLPDAVLHFVVSGDLRGKSIGFLPTKIHSPTPEEVRKRPELAEVRLIYDEAIVLEYAVATVQSNPDALVQAATKAVKAGLNADFLLEAAGLLLPEEVGEQSKTQEEPEPVAETRVYQPSPEEMRQLVQMELSKQIGQLDVDAMVARVIAQKMGRV